MFNSILPLLQLAAIVAAGLQQAPISLGSTLEATLYSLLPKTEADLTNLQRAVDKPCRDFESRLATLGFLSGWTNSTTGTAVAASALDTLSNTSQNVLLTAVVADLPAIFADYK